MLLSSVKAFFCNCNTPSENWCPGYDIKLRPMVTLKFLTSVRYGIPLNCHKSQIYFDPDKTYLIESNLLVELMFINSSYYIGILDSK